MKKISIDVEKEIEELTVMDALGGNYMHKINEIITKVNLLIRLIASKE